MFGQMEPLKKEEREEVEFMDIDSLTVYLFRYLKKNLNTEGFRTNYCLIEYLGQHLFPVYGGSKYKVSDENYFKLWEALACLERKQLVVKVFRRPERSKSNEGPLIYLTDIGIKSDVSDDVILLVDKPEMIVSALEQKIGSLDDVVRQYYLESLRAYQEELYFSSVICLGAASERAVYWLCEAVKANCQQHEPEIRKREGSISKLIDYLIDSVVPNVFSHDKHFAHELLKCLKRLADVYRENRNDAGHPKTLDQGWTNEDQEILLKHFRRYITAITTGVAKSGIPPTP